MGNGLIRYSAALVILIYGFAKLNGAQFTVLDSELDKPMGHISGFWLTWYYFSFSPFYGTFLALVQILGAFLLTFRRTALLGACLLAPVLLNIVLIDVCYRVDLGATLVAAVLLVVMLGLIARQRRQLIALFWPVKSESPASAARGIAQWGVRIAMLALTCGFTYWVANYNNQAPTPIDGSWDVVQVSPQNFSASVPAVFFFEHNRARLAVFKTSDGDYKWHDFEVNQSGHGIQIWELWLAKGNQIFEGTYKLSGADLTLDGKWQDLGAIGLRLRQKRVR